MDREVQTYRRNDFVQYEGFTFRKRVKPEI